MTQAHDRLLAKANEFCSQVAAKYPATCTSVTPPAPQHVPSPLPSAGPPLTATLAGKQPQQEGTLLYHVPIPWEEGYCVGAKLEIPPQPPVDAAIQFTIPPEAEGKGFRLALTLPKPKPTSFSLSGLRLVSLPVPVVEVEATVHGEQDETKQPGEKQPGEKESSEKGEKRPPVQSRIRPPIPFEEALARLSSLGFTLEEAEGEGDCYFLSVMAGHEITASHALHPTPSTRDKVKFVREQAVSLVSGSAPIAGIEAEVWRVEEGLPKTPLGASRSLKRFRQLGHWYDPNRFKSSAVMFAFATHLGRQVAVLEKAHGGILDPCKVYGARKDGKPLHTSTQSGKHAPSWVTIPFDELLQRVKADPSAFSLLVYNGSDHFSPLVLPPTPEASAVMVHSKKRKAASPALMKKAKVTTAPPPGADPSPLTTSNIRGRRVLVIASVWPDYACTENKGAGWSALVVHSGKGWADVEFLDARDEEGEKYKDVRLSLDVLRPL